MKRRELRTFWNSNGLWTNSGYAVEMQQLLPRLAADGWPIAHCAFWGLQGFPVELKDYPNIKVYPKMNDDWGADAMLYHSQDFKAHAVMSFQDTWPLQPQFLQKLPVWIPWLPVDKSPAPQGVLNNLKYAYKIVTFSRFGQKELEKKGFSSTLILEGTDTEIFKPMDKVQARRELSLPQDAFIFGMVAANKENPPRKGFQEALEAFKLFHDKHPEAAMFFQVHQPAPTGFPIQGYAQHLGIQNRMFYTNDYVAVYGGGSKFINKLHNAFDVLLHPSQTEGFGLTIVEAGASGTPVIVNNCTSMPELVVEGVTGAICNTGKPRWGNDNAFTFPADPQSLYEKMEQVYEMVKKDEEKVSKDCRDHIVKNYNIEETTKQWIKVLEELQDELIPLTPTSQSSSMISTK